MAEGEAAFKNLALDLLRSHPAVALVYTVEIPRGAVRRVRSNNTGIPDICGTLWNGRSFYFELKEKNGVKRPNQIAFIERAKKIPGVIAIFAYTMQEIRESLRYEKIS